jgi:malonyl-CoA O-methyltransferase
MNEYHIDKARVRASFDHAAQTYDAAAVLQAEVRTRMFNRLELVKILPELILDAGCGTGHASFELARRFAVSQIISLDIAWGMLQRTKAGQPWLKRKLGLTRQNLLCADIENLPVQSSSMGLVWSNLALQWCNDLDQAFSETYRVLQPGGLFMFSTFGPDTLKELRHAANADPNHVHISRFIDMHDIGDALVRAGYSAPVLDVEQFVLTYDDVLGVMRDLKAIGAHNAAAGRSRGLQGRSFLTKLTQNYERFRKDGKLPATFEVVYGHAWKPGASKSESRTTSLDGSIPITIHKRK